jgi:hypothetical protein
MMVMIILGRMFKKLGRYCVVIIRQSGGTNRPVGAELFHVDGQTDTQTDMTKLIAFVRNFANEPENDAVREYVRMRLFPSQILDCAGDKGRPGRRLR